MSQALAPFAPGGVIEDIVEARAERFESAGQKSIGGGPGNSSRSTRRANYALPAD